MQEGLRPTAAIHEHDDDVHDGWMKEEEEQ